MKKVVIIQRVLVKYRLPFFIGLKEKLSKEGIDLHLVHGLGNKADYKKELLARLEWAHAVKERYISIGEYSFVFQPYLRFLRDADLVIIPQEFKYILNYYLLLKRKFAKFKIAFWGHGLNMQAKPNSLRNLLKRRLNNAADWWFAYSKSVAEFIERNGFPREKITTVQNSIDMTSLFFEVNQISGDELIDLKKKIGIDEKARVGLFCGGMYKEKRLDFLLEACYRIKKEIPEFHMIFIGGGPYERIVKKASQQNPWIHFMGPVFNREQIMYFKISEVFLMPGLVGLAILDCFSSMTPMITTQYPFHSPEIEYLQNGVNGFMTKDDIDEFCKIVIMVLRDSNILKSLKESCLISAKKYSMEQMIENFSLGIIKCLEL